MRKRAVSLALCLCMVLSLLPLPVSAAGKHPFTDVAATDWFNDSVEYVYEHNLMKGTSDTTFAPYRTTQRGMIVTILHRLEGTPAVASGNPFTDVPKGSNYENAIIWASAKGIVTGYDGITFGPYNDVTRQQMAAILYRYAQMKGYDTSGSADLGDYADSSQISNYARTAMAWANGAGLINGNSSKQLMPTGNATRAQTAAILSRFCQNVIPQPTPPSNPPIIDPPIEEPPQPTPTNYSVTFDLNYDDAGVYQTLSVKAGEKITAPTNPKRDGYHFLGWYTATTGGSKFNFNKVINAVTTLYARWSKISSGSSNSGSSGSYNPAPVPIQTSYQVSFNTDGGSDVPTQTVSSGSRAQKPENPKKEEFSFSNWYSDEALTVPYNFESAVTHDTVLYAKWDAGDGDALEIDSTDGDNDGVSAWIEEVMGTSADSNDTDGDGLSDYVEIYSSVTDPTLADTDENGVNDADEDNDSDGLSNIQEVDIGTDLRHTDTDMDGLSDGDEVNIYHTDPLKQDTDADGLIDGDEIALGLNPNVQMTDGVTLDSERRIEQTVNVDNIDGELLNSGNDAVPSLTANVRGNLNRTVSITETLSAGFGDSRSIVGKPVDISGENLDSGTLTFTLSPENVSTIPVSTSDGDVIQISTKLICKYNDDGTTSYLESNFESSSNTISANIDSAGTFFVMDVQALFDELGLAMPSVADLYALQDEPIAHLTSSEVESEQNNSSNENDNLPNAESEIASETRNVAVASADTEKVTLAAAGVMAQADIVFVIDTTGSMGDEINNVKNNVSNFVDALNQRGISAGFALVEYRDIEVDGENTTVVHKNGRSNWFYNMDDYKRAISTLRADGGGDIPESVVDAIETARLLDMRASAGKIFILVTDADYKVSNRYGIPSMATEIELLKNAGVSCSVVTSTSMRNVYSDLYNHTNGIFADINGDFSSELMTIADKIGEEIVGDGHWIYLDGPIPVPIRLDAIPTEGSDTDTDHDGKPDIDELESASPNGEVDLDEIISVMSKDAISDTDYGKVYTYKYRSNPVQEDTDYDGIGDNSDSAPKSDTSRGKLLGYYDVTNSAYTVDYREFFKASNTFSKKIASASLVFSNTIYNDCGFEYSDGTRITDIQELLSRHGFIHTVDKHLDTVNDEDGIEDQAYHDDDISEVGLGYQTISYNGRTITLVAVVIRGTNGTIEEWSSNFDMGNPESWKSNHHKGFYITEERIKEYVSQYVDTLDTRENLVYWITGHSRGAALSNLLAARLIDDGNTVFAYTFATPSTTIDESRNASKYNSIFNYTNTSDLVTCVPLKQWNFGRYGITKEVSIEDSGLSNEWCQRTGRPFYNALNKNLLDTLTNRIYKSCTASWDEVHKRAGTQLIGDKKYSYISYRAGRYCDLYDVSLFGKHVWYELHPSTAFVFQLGAELLAGSDDEKSNAKELFWELWNSKYLGVIVLLLLEVSDDDYLIEHAEDFPVELGESLIGDGHAPATYYVLLQ